MINKVPRLKEIYFNEQAKKFAGIIKNYTKVDPQTALNELKWTTDTTTYGMVAPRNAEKMNWYFGDINISKLPISVWSSKKATEYAKTFKQALENEEIPPIFVEAFWNGYEFGLEIIDGNHRARAAKQCGENYLLGYLGFPEGITLEQVQKEQKENQNKTQKLFAEKFQPLTPDLVTKFRKEFLMIMKNLKNVKTYEQARELNKYINNWGEKLGQHLKEIRSDLESFSYSFRDSSSFEKNEAQSFLNYMQPVWDFDFELKGMPYNITTQHYNYKTKKHDIWLQGELIGYDKEDFRKWEQRLRARARKAWKWLENFSRFSSRTKYPFQVQTKEKENIEIEGFPVQLYGFEDTKFNNELLEKMRFGLKTYRSRASRIVPWLLKYQLPVVANFNSRGTENNAAFYDNDHIEISIWGLSTTGRDFAKIIAHEMGHHIYRTAMSKNQQETWQKFIYGDYKDLNLQEVLKKARPDENLRKLGDRIEKEDPILKLQLDGLYTHYKLYTIKDIQEYIEEGENPIVVVPAHPITAYATKNPEEAFCDALATIVAYGPRALLPKVKYMLNLLSPVRIQAESNNWNLSEIYFGEAKKRPSQMPEIQYHATSWEKIPSIIKKGLQLPRGEKDVATFMHEIPSISTADRPDYAQVYYPKGALLKLKTKGKYLKRSVRQMKKGETLLDSVNRWSKEVLEKGADGFWAEGMQSTVGNQTFNPNILEIIEIVNIDEVPEEIKAALNEEYLGTKGGISYFQIGGSLPKKFYNRKNGKPSKDTGVAGLKGSGKSSSEKLEKDLKKKKHWYQKTED